MANPITDDLIRWNDGDPEALAEVMAKLSAELRAVAGACFRAERGGHTLQPTALVNELFLKLSQRDKVAWQSRAHFFAAAATTMRRILVDHARKRNADKRGGALTNLTLFDEVALTNQPHVEVLDLDDALVTLEDRDPRLCRVVELRFFAGMTAPETARVLGIGEATVHRDLRAAKAFLMHRLKRRSAD